MKLKEIIGSEVFSTLSPEIKAKYEKANLEDVSDGKYIPKSRLDAVLEKIGDYKEQLENKDKVIKDLKKVDVKDLQATIENLNKTIEQNNIKFAAKLEAKDFEYALQSSLSGYNCKNTKIVASQLDKSKIKLVNGELIGLKEQVEALKTSDSYLFNETSKIDSGNFDTGFAGSSKKTKGVNIEDFFTTLGKEKAEDIKNSGLTI